MITYTVKVAPESKKLPKKEQLAWRLAETASQHSVITSAAREEVINRIIDNAGVAAASLLRSAPATARAQAVAHPKKGGSSIFGIHDKVSPEWAAWANGTAVRELDYHDTFLAADYSHPADNIPPILAVAEMCKKSGAEVLRAIACAYEIHISLVKGICLHKHKKDHIAHLAPAQAAGIGCLLGLSTETIYQAINQAVHCSFSTRQSRKGEISSWKAFAPAWAGKIAVEAVDRAMRGEKSPSPIYEGEDSVLAWMLNSKKKEFKITLPEPGENWDQILESYTKEHSAEYQAQAIIDLAFKIRERIPNFEEIKKVTLETSHHTHNVIGTGSNDPQKLDPNASRETLDHSITYILAVALEDGCWHHEDSYKRSRATRAETVKLWQKIETNEDKKWTRAYKHSNPDKRAFGGKLIIELNDGSVITDELARANAHPAGARPFVRNDYLKKFTKLASDSVTTDSAVSFLESVQELENLPPEDLFRLNIISTNSLVSTKKGLFDA